MKIKFNSVYGWSIGSYAKAKYFAVKEQNKDVIYTALGEIVNSNKYAIVAQFSAYISCNDNPELTGIYDVSLYFNRNGDTFFELEEHPDPSSFYLCDLQNKDIEKYRVIVQGMFEAIVSTREFKQFARKATNNIQDCFEDVIEPLYKGELRISNDELTGFERKAINNLMKLKGRIVSSSTLNLSHPKLENT